MIQGRRPPVPTLAPSPVAAPVALPLDGDTCDEVGPDPSPDMIRPPKLVVLLAATGNETVEVPMTKPDEPKETFAPSIVFAAAPSVTVAIPTRTSLLATGTTVSPAAVNPAVVGGAGRGIVELPITSWETPKESFVLPTVCAGAPSIIVDPPMMTSLLAYGMTVSPAAVKPAVVGGAGRGTVELPITSWETPSESFVPPTVCA